jgi:hypothetical protein
MIRSTQNSRTTNLFCSFSLQLKKPRSKVISKRLKIHSSILYESEFQIRAIYCLLWNQWFSGIHLSSSSMTENFQALLSRFSIGFLAGPLFFSIICFGERLLKAISRKQIHAILGHTKRVVVSRKGMRRLSCPQYITRIDN